MDLDVLSLHTTREAGINMEYGIPGENMYTDLLPELARISRGAFSPTGVEERIVDGRAVELSFQLGDVSHRYELELMDDWLDPQIFRIVDEATGDGLYRLHANVGESDDQGGLRVFLTDDERELIERERSVRFVWSPG